MRTKAITIGHLTEDRLAQLEHFRQLVGDGQLRRLQCQGYDSVNHDVRARIVPGRKYTRVDVGGSGKYMVVNATGEIFGIKAYGVVHRGRRYGTLATVDEWDWSGYGGARRPLPPLTAPTQR